MFLWVLMGRINLFMCSWVSFLPLFVDWLNGVRAAAHHDATLNNYRSKESKLLVLGDAPCKEQFLNA